MAAVAGWLVIKLGPEGLGVVLARIADWLSRNDRIVEITIGADTLKLGRATQDQQDRLVNDFLARHATGS
ncbi:MAG TPA: hypothetical protein VMU94_28135 [Streptosporangiaceae bacterium]|nr:hypothetical protein [Streptosporangiaceae bacterium]